MAPEYPSCVACHHTGINKLSGESSVLIFNPHTPALKAEQLVTGPVQLVLQWWRMLLKVQIDKWKWYIKLMHPACAKCHNIYQAYYWHLCSWCSNYSVHNYVAIHYSICLSMKAASLDLHFCIKKIFTRAYNVITTVIIIVNSLPYTFPCKF